MTSFDPGGLLLLLTVIPAVVAGVVSITLAHVAARLGYGTYDTNVVGILAVLLTAWTVAAFLVSTSMLQILAVVLAMIGAFAVTRSITASSYGWVLGVVLLFAAFSVLSAVGVYQGVDQTGRPQGLIARHLSLFYYGGLLIFGAIGGKLVEAVQRRWR
jgi:predicted outer membrane lipoprotein